MADLVNETLASIEARIAELAPLVAEHGRLTKAAQELRGVAKDSARQSNRRRGPSRARPRARGRRGLTWKQRFVAEVEKQPGVTTAELAKRLNVDARRVSTLGSRLKSSGDVKKKGRGFYPVPARG